MAITINQTPEIITPVLNEVTWLVTSTNTAQANFKYVLDLYVTGQTGFIRKARSADLTTGKAYFDVSNELKGYLTSTSDDLNKTDYGFTRLSNSFVEYKAYMGEQYGASSAVTVYSGLTIDSFRYVTPMGKSFTKFKDFTTNEYLLSSSSIEFLSNQPSSLKVRSDEYRWLYAWMSTTDTSKRAYFARVITYNSANAIIQTADCLNVYSGISVPANDKFFKFSSGGANLNLIVGGQLLTGAQPIITATVAKYTVQMFNGSGTAISELQTYVIDDDCSRYSLYTFIFMNELGGFDTYSFIKADKREVSINRGKMKQIVGKITGSTYTYAKKDRQDTIFNTTLKDRITVNSDWVTDDISVWLEQLISSPMVYVDDATHGLVAVSILAETYQIKQNNVDKLFNISFQFEYAYSRTR